MNQYYTYILSNKNDTTLYIGVTNDIERRVAEHRSGTIPGFTQKYKCHKLVYFESFSDVEQAIAREKQLKKWSRAKKDALIDTMNKDRNFVISSIHSVIPSPLLSSRTDGTARAERCLHQFCRVVTEVDVVIVVEGSLRSLHSLCSVEMTFTSLSFWFDEVFYINLRTV